MSRVAFKKGVREAVYKKFEGRCAYCGKTIEMKQMQIDHVKPVYLGGTNDLENLFPACRSCNFYKSTFTIEKFREELSRITQRLAKNMLIYRLGKDYGLIEETKLPVVFYFEKESK